MITKYHYVKLLEKVISEKNEINKDFYISENSGSILNGILSSFVISKIILNDMTNIKNKDTFIGDLMGDQYFFIESNIPFVRI